MPYVFVDGVMQKVHSKELLKPSAPLVPLIPMAVVCSVDQLYEATEAADASNIRLITTNATVKEIERFSDPKFGSSDFAQKYKSPEDLDGVDILTKIGFVFSNMKYQ